MYACGHVVVSLGMAPAILKCMSSDTIIKLLANAVILFLDPWSNAYILVLEVIKVTGSGLNKDQNPLEPD